MNAFPRGGVDFRGKTRTLYANAGFIEWFCSGGHTPARLRLIRHVLSNFNLINVYTCRSILISHRVISPNISGTEVFTCTSVVWLQSDLGDHLLIGASGKHGD